MLVEGLTRDMVSGTLASSFPLRVLSRVSSERSSEIGFFLHAETVDLHPRPLNHLAFSRLRRLGTTNICCCIDGDYNPLRMRHCRLMLDDVASRNTESYNAIYKRLQMYIADNQARF